ncbi:hypothetical protein O181_114238, partial [Austropuccinia psidii MF-1]|nr:hypothetical protein [Austropuccinia psidii MF-1]
QTLHKLCGNQLQAQLTPNEPSQPDEPPILGPSPSSEAHEDVPTSRPAPPPSVIIIDDMPVRSPPPLSPSVPVPHASTPALVVSSDIPAVAFKNPIPSFQQ